MTTSAFYPFDCLVADLQNGVHDLETDSIKLTLCLVAPTRDGTVLESVVPIDSIGNLQSAAVPISSSNQIDGIYICILSAVTIVAHNGALGPFRYISLYNDTQASKPLICWFDYGSELTLADGESVTLNFASNILFNARFVS